MTAIMDGKMRGATCFSGIGAPEMGLPDCDWIWHAEIEPFPSAVMAQRHPESVNLGDVLADDFIERAKSMGPLDIMAGGPPCQAFSVAGLRGSMSDPRGNLTLRWVQILHAVQPRNAITENVPGWLNTPDNAFGCFLAGLVGADDALRCPGDAGWPRAGMASGPLGRLAWATLDAQYFGLAQRRNRVFAVADFGNGADPAEILFNAESVFGNPAPSRETGKETAADVAPSLVSSGRGVERTGETRGQDPVVAVGFGGGNCSGPIEIATALSTSNQRLDFDTETMIAAPIAGTLPAGGNRTGGDRPPGMSQESADTFLIAHSLRGEGFDASEDGTGRGTPIVPVAYRTTGNCGAWETGDKVDTLTQSSDPNSHVIAMQAGATRENPESGPDGVGVRSDGLDYTLEARAEVQAVAFQAENLDRNLGTDYSNAHASTSKTNAYSSLLELREAVGEKIFAEWGLGISHSFQSSDILRPEVYGARVRHSPSRRNKLGNNTLSRPKDSPQGAMCALWKAGCKRRAPQGWRPSKQLTDELGTHLSLMSQSGASSDNFLHDLWRAAEGLGLLREALSAIQETRRPDEGDKQATSDVHGMRETRSQQEPLRNALHAGETVWQVRRLTVVECSRLQGFPDDYPRITYRGKVAADGNIYKALGNSWAVPVGRWILQRTAALLASMGRPGE